MGGVVGPVTEEPFVGPASYWVDEIGRLAEMGMDAFIFWPGGENPIAQAESFAIEVASVVRGGAIAQERT